MEICPVLTKTPEYRHFIWIGYGKPLISEDRMTVASYLKERGYSTACIRKWHLGWTWPLKGKKESDIDYEVPIHDGSCSVGFDYFYGISGSLDMPPYVYVENRNVTAVPPENPRKISKIWTGKKSGGLLAELLSIDLLCGWIPV